MSAMYAAFFVRMFSTVDCEIARMHSLLFRIPIINLSLSPPPPTPLVWPDFISINPFFYDILKCIIFNTILIFIYLLEDWMIFKFALEYGIVHTISSVIILAKTFGD